MIEQCIQSHSPTLSMIDSQLAFRYIMNPISQLIHAIMENDAEKYEKMMDRLGIVLKGVTILGMDEDRYRTEQQ